MSRELGAAGRPIEAVGFLVGDWDLDYTATINGETRCDLGGRGIWRRLFGETYLIFDYQTQMKDSGETVGEAHGLLAWDAKAAYYRYFWFESSGTFQEATGVLRDADTLALDWQDGDCKQIFRRVDGDALYLEMDCPAQKLFLRVDFRRRAP